MDKGVQLWPDSAVLVVPPSLPAEELPLLDSTASPAVIEFQNRDVLRGVRILQRNASGIGGPRAITRIEVWDGSSAGSSPGGALAAAAAGGPQAIFSVKHRHTNSAGWVRQMIICRNALWASTLAGCAADEENCPLGDVLPTEAYRDFTQHVSPLHLHTYVEKVLLHIRLNAFTSGAVRLVWWRPIYHGAAVLVNEASGRVLAAPCEAPTFQAAARAVFKALAALQLSATPTGVLPPELPNLQLSVPDPEYAAVLNDEEEAGHPHDGEHELDEDYDIRSNALAAAEHEWIDIVRDWAAEVKASPWLTDYVLKFSGRRGARMIRYSIDMSLSVVAENAPAADAADGPAMLVPPAIAMQVHMNEPLSRETHAFPVCSLRFPLPAAPLLGDVRKNFAKALWFLRKFFSIHVQAAAAAATS